MAEARQLVVQVGAPHAIRAHARLAAVAETSSDLNLKRHALADDFVFTSFSGHEPRSRLRGA